MHVYILNILQIYGTPPNEPHLLCKVGTPNFWTFHFCPDLDLSTALDLRTFHFSKPLPSELSTFHSSEPVASELSTFHSPLPSFHSPLSTFHSPLFTLHFSLSTLHFPLVSSSSLLEQRGWTVESGEWKAERGKCQVQKLGAQKSGNGIGLGFGNVENRESRGLVFGKVESPQASGSEKCKPQNRNSRSIGLQKSRA